jgi:two-component system sensor histidine kinase/response regulator
MERLGGDQQMLVQLVEVFSQDYPILLKDMHHALNEGNGAALASATHALQSMAANLGAHEILRIAQELENQGANNALENTLSQIERLTDALNHLRNDLTGCLTEAE